MNRILVFLAIAAILVIAIVIPFVRPASAGHESTNTLTFAVPMGSGDASGAGTVTYHGGEVDTSRWTAQFSFSGLESGQRYVVVVKGRFGEDGSPEADAFTPLCGRRWYHRGLRRLGTVQLRSGNEERSGCDRASGNT